MPSKLLKSFKNRYMLQDPGLLKTRQASRTVIAACLAALCLINLPTTAIICGALAAGYVSQGIYGESRREQQKTFFISTSLIIGYFALCSFTAPHFFATSAVLLLSSFFVFYMRGISPRYLTFPMYVWVMGFTATTLTPPQSLAEHYLRIGATLVGCIAAYISHFYILPVKRERTFFDNIEQWFEHLWEILFWLETVFTHNVSPEDFHEQEQIFTDIIATLYRHNQHIIDAYLQEAPHKPCSLEPYFLAQYLSIRSIRVLINSIKYCHEKKLPPEIIAAFKEGLELLREALSLYTVKSNRKTIELSGTLPNIELYASRFESLASKCTLSLEEDLLYVFNFILGFRQLAKNLEKFTTPAKTEEVSVSETSAFHETILQTNVTPPKVSLSLYKKIKKFIHDLSPTTRMAIQAAIAISIAISLERTLSLERSYWAVLTSVVLISQTWGASVKKSYERVFMTIIGGAVGTSIYFLTKDIPYADFPLLLLSAYFSIYFYEISYLATTFFVSNFVVYFFAQLQTWTAHLLYVRAFETCVGAVIAVLVSTFILPIKAKSSVKDKMVSYLQFARHLTHMCIHAFDDTTTNMTKLAKHGQTLYKLLSELRQFMEQANFEVSFKGGSRGKLKALLADFSALYYYLTTLVDIIPGIYLHKHIAVLLQQELMTLASTLDNNFAAVISLLNNQFEGVSFSPFQEIRAPVLEKVKMGMEKGELQKADWFEFYSLIFFIKKVNDVLINIESTCLLDKVEAVEATSH